MENNNHEIWQNNYKRRRNDYLIYSGGERWQRFLIESICESIGTEKDNVNRIADIGCGAGDKTALLADIFSEAKVTGIDFSEDGIMKAREMYKSNKLEFELLDITKIESTKQYDLVSSFQVLEHLDDWKQMLSRICDISGKYVIISVPTGRMRPYERYEGHLRNFKRGEIEAFMIDIGFEVVEAYYAGFPFYSPLERDVKCLSFNKDKEAEGSFEYSGGTKFVHDMVFLIYRHLNSKRIGDQFLGLFQRVSA